MSKQQFSAVERQAIYEVHGGKCIYTGKLIDLRDMHLDHIVPERLAKNITSLEKVKRELNLSDDFDILGYENIIPSCAGANQLKSGHVFDQQRAQFYLGVAHAKKADILKLIERLNQQIQSGKAILLLQRLVESNKISMAELAEWIPLSNIKPEDIFKRIEDRHLLEKGEVLALRSANFSELREMPVRLGDNDFEGIEFINDKDDKVWIRTCKEYETAQKQGFYPLTNFDIKMSVFLEHQCGLLNALELSKTPKRSFVDMPRKSILDLDLMPFSLFPSFGPDNGRKVKGTYQDQVDKRKLKIKNLKSNLLVVESTEIGQQLIEAARGDFNGDGLEDILLFEYCYAVRGTMGFGGVKILTRRSADSIFEGIDG